MTWDGDSTMTWDGDSIIPSPLPLSQTPDPSPAPPPQRHSTPLTPPPSQSVLPHPLSSHQDTSHQGSLDCAGTAYRSSLKINICPK